MTRPVTKFGQMPAEAPPGTFKRIHFPMMALLDQGTQEGMLSRILHSDGGDVRELPRTIYFQKSQTAGHDDAVAIAALYEVTLDAENGVLRDGWGWVADVPEGRDAAAHIIAKSLFHNSIDMSDVKQPRLEVMFDEATQDLKVEMHFEEWKLGATTLVGKPAFANASAEIVEDEIMAALMSDEPLVVDCENVFTAHTPAEEICAGSTSLPSWDYFHRAEADIPHSIIVGTKDANGWMPIYGHLAQWNKPHTGYDGRQIYAPRPRNGYKEWNKPGPLTTKGQVETGPMVLYGGHISLADACNDPRNAWADVRVTEGKHGPWICGIVRPHIAEDDAHTYVARASQISGHWKGDNLRMIVSVNYPGFNIDGKGWEPGEPDELVAGFVPDAADLSMTELSETRVREIFVEMISQAQLAGQPLLVKGPAELLEKLRLGLAPNSALAEADAVMDEIEGDFEFRKRKLAAELALEADEDPAVE